MKAAEKEGVRYEGEREYLKELGKKITGFICRKRGL